MHKLKDNSTNYWDPKHPGKSFNISEIREPILFIEIVLTRFRALVDGDRERYIAEERCGCLPPCFERRMTLRAVKEAVVETYQSENIEVFYDVKVQGWVRICKHIVSNDFIALQFSRDMKVYTQFFRKTAISLIAEIGGYLGLFLGWSGLSFVAFFEGYMRRSLKSGKKGMLSAKK